MAKAKRTKPAAPELGDTSLPVTEQDRAAAQEHLHKDDEEDLTPQNIALIDIFPSPTNPRKHFDPASITELAGSIKRHRVIQAITVRNKKGMAGKYEIVCGERRWLASREAGRATIPAVVRDLTDDEVLDLQFTENLQRQDVHPMDEAVTFKAMIETTRYTVPDIAAKVLKGEAFVLHRLSLNNLIPAFQQDFWEGKFLIGHAVIFSRLTEADQKELYKQYGGRQNYDTLVETKDYIDSHINRKLSSAPFKKDDATLVPKAGACISCPKRSGCSPELFNDYDKKDDRCFDKACYQKKLDAFLLKKVETTINEKPGILLIDQSHYGEKVDPAIKKLAAGMKVDIIEPSANSLQSWSSPGYIPIQALVVAGSDAGKIKTFYKRSSQKASSADGTLAKRTAKVIDEEIAGIEQRQARALELDGEKIWEKVEKLLEEPTNLTLPFVSDESTQEERNAMAYALMEEIDDDEYQEVAGKFMKMGNNYTWYHMDIEEAYIITQTTTAQIFGLLRLFFLSKLKSGSSHLTSGGPYILMPVLKTPGYLPAAITEIEKEQEAASSTRIANANKRIEKLKKEKEALPAPKEKPAKKSASRNAKIAKGIQSLLDQETEEDQEEDE